MADYIYSDKTLPQSYGIRDTLEPLPLDQVPF
jgi:hypothetical protein